jgi:endonuclease/exonuclease/phosphatase (EEP) superfamily protein YafD
MIRVFATVIGLLMVVLALAGLVVRYVPIPNHAVLVVAVASPYLMALALVGLLIFAVGRRWLLTALTAGLCVAMVVVVAPMYVGPEKTAGPSVGVRLMTANLLRGQANPYFLSSLARKSVDVLSVQELTPELAAGLSAAGLDAGFPYRIIKPGPGPSGIGIWSRYPIIESSGEDTSTGMAWARLDIPDVVIDPMVIAAHFTAPWPQDIDFWDRDLTNFAVALRRAAKMTGAGAVIAAGDFNATLDMSPFRRLLSDGYRDAAEQAGAGMARTFPNRRRIWPIIGIDHAFVRNCVATSLSAVSVTGSDHRALLTTIDIPVDPTAS